MKIPSEKGKRSKPDSRKTSGQGDKDQSPEGRKPSRKRGVKGGAIKGKGQPKEALEPVRGIKRILAHIENIIGQPLEKLEPKEGYVLYIGIHNDVSTENPAATFNSPD